MTAQGQRITAQDRDSRPEGLVKITDHSGFASDLGSVAAAAADLARRGGKPVAQGGCALHDIPHSPLQYCRNSGVGSRSGRESPESVGDNDTAAARGTSRPSVPTAGTAPDPNRLLQMAWQLGHAGTGWPET